MDICLWPGCQIDTTPTSICREHDDLFYELTKKQVLWGDQLYGLLVSLMDAKKEQIDGQSI